MALAHRILFWDLETAPAIANVWRAKTDYVPMDMMLAESFIINWGAKWAGQSKVYSGLVTPEEAKNRDDSRIIADLAPYVRQADAIIAHNVNGFDLPVLNGRVLKYGIEPLGPCRTVDTLTLSRQAFGLPYHKLDYLGNYLGVGRKIKTDIDLWKRCVAGDQRALNEMRRYNRQDVLLLERVFEVMKPYVTRLPRMFDASREGERICPSCGSSDLMARGYQRTQASTFGRLCCNKCGRYSRYRTVERLKKIGVHPL